MIKEIQNGESRIERVMILQKEEEARKALSSSIYLLHRSTYALLLSRLQPSTRYILWLG